MNYGTPSNKAARSIRALISGRRESIETLAEETGIAHSTLKRRLLGMSPFTIDELGAIAEHYSVAISDLLQPPFEGERASA